MNEKSATAKDGKRYRTLFTEQEDVLLRNIVESQSEEDWATVAKDFPNRSPRQCRERWRNYLSPNLIRLPWSSDEDKILFRKVQKYGRHWECLVSFFQGRSRNDIKNRWNTINRKAKGLGCSISNIEKFVHIGNMVQARIRNVTTTLQPEVQLESDNPAELYKIANLLVQ
jgi:hypothetical protein